MNIKVRKYRKSDHDKVMELFHSNTPTFFEPIEEKDFLSFLNQDQEEYDVLLHDNQIVGAGGYRTEKKEDARICWYMIKADYHGRGFGRYLLEYHLNQIVSSGKFKKVSLMTSQFTDGFYESLGFETLRTQKDYWAQGFDLYYMEKKL